MRIDLRRIQASYTFLIRSPPSDCTSRMALARQCRPRDVPRRRPWTVRGPSGTVWIVRSSKDRSKDRQKTVKGPSGDDVGTVEKDPHLGTTTWFANHPHQEVASVKKHGQSHACSGERAWNAPEDGEPPPGAG
eukprot:scaffold2858_cov659-Pavlova_lutheri.AAC.92